MNPITKQMLDYQIEQSRNSVADMRKHVEAARAQLTKDEQKLAGQIEHLTALESLRAIATGQFTTLPPGAVQADENEMGLTVGPLRLAPSSIANLDDVRLYLGTIRAVQDATIRQIALALEEIQHREQQATQSTAVVGDDAIAQGVEEADARAMCELCQYPLIRVRGTFLHAVSRQEECRPDAEPGVVAKPVNITPLSPLSEAPRFSTHADQPPIPGNTGAYPTAPATPPGEAPVPAHHAPEAETR